MTEDQKKLQVLNNKLNDELNKHNSAHLGAAVVVRIPDIPAKIRKIPQAKHEGDYSVEYTAKRWYDKEAGQSRNEKYIIGTILAEYPKAMLPNDTYYRFFDGETGRLLQNEESEEEQEESGGATGENTTEDAGKRTEGNSNKSISGKAEKTTSKTDVSSGNQSDTQAGKPSGLEKGDGDSETPDFKLFLESLNHIREQFAEAEQREKDRQEREKRKKKAVELYGEGYEDEQEIREATESLMKLFTDVQPAEKTGDKQSKEEKQTGNEENHEEKQAGNEQHNGGKQTGNEENKGDERTLAEAYTDYQQSRERAAILYHILDEICDSIKIQAKKRPDAIVNTYKIIRINTILSEIRDYCRGIGYEDLMETAELPREKTEHGVTVMEGISYSDLEILLDHYHTILYFLEPWKKK